MANMKPIDDLTYWPSVRERILHPTPEMATTTPRVMCNVCHTTELDILGIPSSAPRLGSNSSSEFKSAPGRLLPCSHMICDFCYQTICSAMASDGTARGCPISDCKFKLKYDDCTCTIRAPRIPSYRYSPPRVSKILIDASIRALPITHTPSIGLSLELGFKLCSASRASLKTLILNKVEPGDETLQSAFPAGVDILSEVRAALDEYFAPMDRWIGWGCRNARSCCAADSGPGMISFDFHTPSMTKTLFVIQGCGNTSLKNQLTLFLDVPGPSSKFSPAENQ
ncbi:hypothetical protein QBC34DRAFT_496555 [Podospora aff. communis PSN243]|uniref:RING-type domain-containing protein n=1 Tax=Podospora aff. communis PSN243 TaxID=3040156 RepID=A0AAV9GER2_9PEZI|nr:hypothetical protein QBC34DRAFT_496555 [Podospora aff. communis PSN243]